MAISAGMGKEMGLPCLECCEPVCVEPLALFQLQPLVFPWLQFDKNLGRAPHTAVFLPAALGLNLVCNRVLVRMGDLQMDGFNPPFKIGGISQV